MKPYIEINGRYFVEGEIEYYKYIGLKVLYKNCSLYLFHDQIDQSLPLGKCWVELEKFINEWGTPKACFKIKLDQSGKAVVLTELPKSVRYQSDDYYCKACDTKIDKPSCGSLHCQAMKYSVYPDLTKQIDQSPDELADGILSEYLPDVSDEEGNVAYSTILVLRAMQEYHRRMSEGMFTKEEIEQAFNDARLEESIRIAGTINYYYEFTFENFKEWFESRKEKK